MKRALEANPAVIEADFSKIVRQIATSREEFVTFASILYMGRNCDVVQLDNVDAGECYERFVFWSVQLKHGM